MIAPTSVAVQANVHVDVSQIVERLIAKFDREPETKARIAEALLALDGSADPSAGDHERSVQHGERTSPDHRPASHAGQSAPVARALE